MEIKIRSARQEELHAILDVYACAKQFMEAHGNTDQWTGDDAVTMEGLTKLLENGQLFVGVVPTVDVNTDPEEAADHKEDHVMNGLENTGAGAIQFVFAYILGEDPTYKVIEDGAWLNDEPYGTVHRVASAGTAKGVVKSIANWALTQNPNLRIDTHHDNVVMQGALAKEGFTRCGIIRLANGDPRIAYQKRL